jgi:peptide/nickel transport system substrate-binding protein
MRCRSTMALRDDMRAVAAYPSILRAAAMLLVAGLAAPSALAQSGADLARASLVGRVEGPQLMLGPDQVPKEFHEAPMLAERVKAGELPSVRDRIPRQPLVIAPLHEIGKYGGTWRRGFTGPGDVENGNRINASDKLIFWDETGTKIVPSVARSIAMSGDGRRFTMHLREGMRWSDGAPFTADDFVFWFEDLYGNEAIVPVPVAEMAVNGKPGLVLKLDETTVEFRFEDPYYVFSELLAGDTPIGGGQSHFQAQTFTFGAYAPKHYLKQFLPKYAGAESLARRAHTEGFRDWIAMLHAKKDWSLNPELPTLGPWKTVEPITKPRWVLERNPYYYTVDSAGNQLPYIDRIVMTLVGSTDELNQRAAAGEYDWQERHVDLSALPVLLENQRLGDYTVRLDLGVNGADTVLQVNQSYAADPEIATWLTNADFRRALSLGIDREQLKETFWLGVGTTGSVAPSEASPYSPGPEWRKNWSILDRDNANQLLDAIGLAGKDAEGFRLRSDNGERLVLRILTATAFLPWRQQAEMIAQQWKRIGIFGAVEEQERDLAFARLRNNEHHIMLWTNNGTEMLYLFPRHALPVDPLEAFMGPEFALWYASNGRKGVAPSDPQLVEALDLFRSAAGQREPERIKTAQKIWRIIVDQQYEIGTVGQSPAFQGVRIVSNKLRNVPQRVCIAQHCRTPGGAHPETWYFVE